MTLRYTEATQRPHPSPLTSHVGHPCICHGSVKALTKAFSSHSRVPCFFAPFTCHGLKLSTRRAPFRSFCSLTVFIRCIQ